MTEKDYDEFYEETTRIINGLIELEVAKFLASLERKLSKATGLLASEAWQLSNGCTRNLEYADRVTATSRWISSVNGGLC